MRRANANGIAIEYDCVESDPAEPMPMPLGTRDALHLATALRADIQSWRDASKRSDDGARTSSGDYFIISARNTNWRDAVRRTPPGPGA